MAQCEDVVRKNIMDAEVVYISDDDERDENNSKAAKTKTKHTSYLHNVYENYVHVPPSVQAALESIQNKTTEEQLKRLQDVQISNSDEEDVVYVPDDHEEQELLIGPIDRISHEIIYGKNLQPPTEFPYKLLEEIEKHLIDSLKNVSFTTEAKVWTCVLNQLSLMRIEYQDRIDVSNLEWHSFCIGFN